MKEYSKEESIELVNKINKMQRFIFRYKKDNGKEPTSEEILKGINISSDELEELNSLLKELEEQDKEFEYVPTKHSPEDIKKAREIRKSKKEVKDIPKYMQGE